MASAVYPLGIKAIMQGDITGGLDAADIKICIVDTADYTYSAAHNDLADVAGASIVGTTGNLQSKTIGTVGTGVFDAADITISAVTGDSVEAAICYWDSGEAATSILLSYNELAGAVTPNGGDITLALNAGGIFVL